MITAPDRTIAISALPDPCAIVDAGGQICATNRPWQDRFVQVGLGDPLLAAGAALFRWADGAWARVEAELKATLIGGQESCRFEAILHGPEQRRCASWLGRLSDGGLIWQLRELAPAALHTDDDLHTLRQIRDGVDSIAEGFALYDAEDRLVYCNPRYRQIYADSADLMVPGRTFSEIIRMGAERGQYPEAEGRVEEWVAERLRRHQSLEPIEQQVSGGRWLQIVERRTRSGGIVGVRVDITSLKQAEQIRRQSEVQAEVIRAQEALLAELSSPLLQISERAVLMPLVGAIDTHRASRIIASLLSGVGNQRVRVAILDITGVSVVDTQVAHTFIQAARAVELLGARLVLTGIRPDVAQTIVALGVDLGTIITRADLQEGIRYALTA